MPKTFDQSILNAIFISISYLQHIKKYICYNSDDENQQLNCQESPSWPITQDDNYIHIPQ